MGGEGNPKGEWSREVSELFFGSSLFAGQLWEPLTAYPESKGCGGLPRSCMAAFGVANGATCLGDLPCLENVLNNLYPNPHSTLNTSHFPSRNIKIGLFGPGGK